MPMDMQRCSCVMSLVLDIILLVAIVNIDMIAHTQSKKIEDYEGLKCVLFNNNWLLYEDTSKEYSTAMLMTR